jgi:hypothetical protein
MGVCITSVPKSYTIERVYDARMILERLSDKFSIEPPRLKWSHGRRRGIYLNHDDCILLGPRAWSGPTDTLLHCFAHAVTHKHQVEDSYHGLKFLDTLWHVVSTHYDGMPERYSWYSDHNAVFEYGRNKLRSLRWD